LLGADWNNNKNAEVVVEVVVAAAGSSVTQSSSLSSDGRSLDGRTQPRRTDAASTAVCYSHFTLSLSPSLAAVAACINERAIRGQTAFFCFQPRARPLRSVRKFSLLANCTLSLQRFLLKTSFPVPVQGDPLSI
jgi:hypothetical protein